jgi:hypothetical protein
VYDDKVLLAIWSVFTAVCMHNNAVLPRHSCGYTHSDTFTEANHVHMIHICDHFAVQVENYDCTTSEGAFDCGVALHACGDATDMSMARCLQVCSNSRITLILLLLHHTSSCRNSSDL